ncbi:hypothetical protein [Pseudocolwellia agarivorans]|uniref:hypothetical protein n=1 Tax=Pseudocolwellia agarivorans TaxID=1911682 RepID=UPI003F880F8E
MTNEPSIAVAWCSPGGATAEMSIAIEELTSKRLKPVRLGDLAGPNETIQILLNGNEWVLILKGIAVLYGAEIVKEAAKSTWKNVSPIINNATKNTLSSIKKLANAAKNAKRVEAPVIYGFPIDLPNGRRHIGIEINDASDESISRTIVALANCWPQLEIVIKQLTIEHEKGIRFSFEQNSDCSTKIELTDEGCAILKVTYYKNGDYSSREQKIYYLSGSNH